uniref:UPAR/Ly6 domain-containing protein n=1 Tax=Strongyloides papillosus TaxID=174720 RepID=A0A0N5BGN8_STREA
MCLFEGNMFIFVKGNFKEDKVNTTKVDCGENECATMNSTFIVGKDTSFSVELKSCFQKSLCLAKNKTGDISYKEFYDISEKSFNLSGLVFPGSKVNSTKDSKFENSWDNVTGQYTLECCDKDFCNGNGGSKISGDGSYNNSGDGASKNSDKENSAESGVTKYSIISVVSTIFLVSFLMIR